MRRRSWGRRYKQPVDFDKEKLNELFRRLRSEHLVAKQNFLCCGSCAGYEIATDYLKKRDAGEGSYLQGYVFYHKQDGEGLRERGETYLAFGQLECWGDSKDGPKYKGPLSTEEVGKIIQRLCEELNIKYEWNGSAATRFHIDLTEPLRAPPPPPPNFIADGI
jgi:hypothetical protein